MRKKRDTAKKQLFFDTARVPKYPTFRASPSEGTAENHLHKNSSQVGCVIGRAHARAQPQHASGAYGPGRILWILGRVEKSLFFRSRFGRSKNHKNPAVERQRVAKVTSQVRWREVSVPEGSVYSKKEGSF